MKKLLLPFLVLSLTVMSCSVFTGESEEVDPEITDRTLVTADVVEDFLDYLETEEVRSVVNKIKDNEELTQEDLDVLGSLAVAAVETGDAVRDEINQLGIDFETYMEANPEASPVEFWLQVVLALVLGVFGGKFGVPLVRTGGSALTSMIGQLITGVLGVFMKKK